MLESPKSIAELTGLFQKQSLNDANDSDLSYRLAKLYLRNGEFEEAKSILKKLLKESGDNVKIMVDCANCYIKTNDTEEANFLLERVLELKPGYVPAFIALASLNEQNNNISKQIHFLMLAANAAPDKYEIRLAVAEQLRKHGDLNGAETQYKLLLEAFPELETAAFSLGLLLLKKNSITEAATYFKKILNNNPGAFDAHFNLANCFFRQKKYAAAINHFRFAMRKADLTERAMYLSAQCFFKLKDFDRAVVTMEKLCETDENNVPYKKCLAEFYEVIEEFDMAAEIYSRLLTLAPQRAEFYLKLASCLIKLSEYNKAEKTLSSMFRQHPGNLEGHKILGELFCHKKSFKNAVEEYQRILMFNDKYPGIYINLASVYRETNNKTEEQKALKHAVDLGEETPETLLRLGQLELELGIVTSADRFKRITEIAPESKFAREAEYYIKHIAA